MTLKLEWAKSIASAVGPRYLAIADAIERAIDSGTLAAGDQLPPQRTLCTALEVDLSTVTRAYAEVKRRGLTLAEVGRGTFVRRRRHDAPMSLWQQWPEDGFIDLSHNFPRSAPDNPMATLLAGHLAEAASNIELQGLQADCGHITHRTAMADWLQQSGIEASAPEIIITAGAQHGVLLAIQSVLNGDDVLLCENTTFYGALSAAKFLGKRVHGVDMDEEGLLPAALERALQATGARTLYCNPTLHNPTTAIMSDERRRHIVSICRRHDATIIEDDVYGFLLTPRVTTLCELAPERTVYVSGFSKILGPGARVGVIRAPGQLVFRIGTGLRATSLMAPGPMVEAVCRLIVNGDIALMASARREQIAERQAWAAEVLRPGTYMTKPVAFHVWLGIGSWGSEAFAAVARKRNVAVAPGALFSANGPGNAGAAIRLCISASHDKEQLQQAIKVVMALIKEGPYAARSIV